MWPTLVDMSKDECKRALRSLGKPYNFSDNEDCCVRFAEKIKEKYFMLSQSWKHILM